MGRKLKKLIPKEIRPAAPFIAAYFGGPLLGKALFKRAQFAKATTLLSSLIILY